ncbi:hypothetical protein IIA79_05660, partial [bacterium]|nr:hypothetical protein [bacterium]
MSRAYVTGLLFPLLTILLAGCVGEGGSPLNSAAGEGGRDGIRASIPADQLPGQEALVQWPLALPEDALQPWEELDS